MKLRSLRTVVLLLGGVVSPWGVALAAAKVVVFPVTPIPGEVELSPAKEMTEAILEELKLHQALEPIEGRAPAGAMATPERPGRPARSDGAYQKALGLLKDGTRQARRLRFSQAVKALRQGVDGLTANLDLVANYNQLIDAYLLLSVAHFRRGREAEGTKVLEQVVRLRPNLNLDPDEYPPMFRDIFAETRRRGLERARGGIRVASVPPGATVLLNGMKLGKTPLTIKSVIPGTNHLVVRMKDSTWAEVVDVREGTLVQSHANLGAAGSGAPVSMGDAIAANRFDRDTRKTARKLAREAGGDWVILLAMGRGQGIYAVGGFLGNARTGRWVALEPMAPDLDLLSTSIEAHALARNVAEQVESFEPDVGNETMPFVAGKFMGTSRRAAGLKEAIVQFIPTSTAQVASRPGRRAIRPEASPTAGGASRGPVASSSQRGPITSRRPSGPSSGRDLDAAVEPRLEALPVEPAPPKAQPRPPRRGGRGPVVSGSMRQDDASGPVIDTDVEILDDAEPIYGTDTGSYDTDVEILDEDTETAAVILAADATAGTSPMAVDLEAEAEEAGGSVLGEWWLWSAVGVGVLAVGFGGYFLFIHEDEPKKVKVYAVW